MRMNATDILLKWLEEEGFIRDSETARSEVKTDRVSLKTDTDLFIRDAITGIGKILKEDLENHYYITTVRIGGTGNVLTQAIIKREEKEADIAVYAHEGLIKQHLADKTLEQLRKLVSQRAAYPVPRGTEEVRRT